MRKYFFLPYFLFLITSTLFVSNSFSQDTVKATFINGDTIRVKSGSDSLCIVTIKIKIPLNQNKLKKGKIKVTVDETSTVDLSATGLPQKSEFAADSLRDSTINYTVLVPRDFKDDKVLNLSLNAIDSQGKTQSIEGKNKTTVYIKPLGKGTVENSNSWESWFMTGTNFDPFDGVKAQEFFFRSNTLLKISKKFYAQIAFYKNRYFSSDSTSNMQVFQPNSPAQIINGTDTSYSYLRGTYQANTNQKIDPVGVQFDVLYKFGENDIKGNSNFFLSCGFDISTKHTHYNRTKIFQF